jgi:hypothetical protein
VASNKYQRLMVEPETPELRHVNGTPVTADQSPTIIAEQYTILAGASSGSSHVFIGRSGPAEIIGTRHRVDLAIRRTDDIGNRCA